jgi:malonyl-CoA O-methyltransferase
MAGHALSAIIARAPFLWPLLRGPTQRFWQRAAGGWDTRTSTAEGMHLAPLMAACDHLAAPGRILDLGTGTGAGAYLLAERFPEAEVWALDLSPAMISAARAKLPAELEGRLHFAVGDAASVPYESASFDLVCQLNLPLYAAEAVRVLAPGGHVLVASSSGARTPYYTSEAVLRRRFERLGLKTIASEQAGRGTYFLARRD